MERTEIAMNEATKSLPIFSTLSVVDQLRPPLINDRWTPLSARAVRSDPRETAQSTVHQVTARTEMTSAEAADAEAPLRFDGRPDHAAKGDDELMSQPAPQS